MIKIKTVTAKNFLSIGNVTQAVNFDKNELTLVLGENLDLGGDDAGARNGVGKTAILNALSYALYGQALTNIKKDNLINKTNNKHMLVTAEFECDGQEYRIERGRRPAIFKFFVNAEEKAYEDDNSQGDSRQTQKDVEKLLGMSHDMFKHVVALNTYTEPFLSLPAAQQRSIIEQLLGIVQLSEKAEALKEQIKTTKDLIAQEEYTIKANQDANKRIQEQLNNLKKRQVLWQKKREEDLLQFERQIGHLSRIDIEQEISLFKLLKEYNASMTEYTSITKHLEKLASDYTRAEKNVRKIVGEVSDLEQHKCYACGQKLHDTTQTSIIDRKKDELKIQESLIAQLEADMVTCSAERENIRLEKVPPKPYYETEEEAFNHKSTLAHLLDQNEMKLNEQDPYEEQIHDMENKALVKIAYDEINALKQLQEHQEFLLKLLTNKDSFIRKRIIDQNLSYLNSRLAYYLDKIGLPHKVTFMNDLSVDIQELGRDLDFDNLSRGERNRLILSLSWSFRDVWESLYKPINLLFIDELIDSGLDASGVESSLAILKYMTRRLKKSIWLISHKDELTTRVNDVLYVVKENGFTSFSNDAEKI